MTVAVRDDRRAPHQYDHERSVAAKARQPVRLRDYVRELVEAQQAETVARLHTGGVEWEPVRAGDSDAGGSHMGGPRWTTAFRAYVTGGDCDTDRDGEWRWPLRSSVFRLSVSRSGTDRLAARYVFLLMHHRFNVREAWAVQCGALADPAIADAAEAWALVALHRQLAARPMAVAHPPRGAPWRTPLLACE